MNGMSSDSQPDTPSGLSGMENLARYIYEVGHLKVTPRAGWTLAGVTQPESVAEHVSRVAVIGFVLAHLEGADPWKTVTLCVFHDNAETRLGDIPSVGKKYFPKVAETQVIEDQVEGLPPELAERIVGLAREFNAQGSQEARLAKDADRLECLVQAREYVDSGFDEAALWMNSMKAALQSENSHKLADILLADSASGWWHRFVVNYRGSAKDVSDL